MRELKLMAEFECFPLWETVGAEASNNLNPDELRIAFDLKAALHNWAASYDRTLNQDYPPDSGFSSPEEEEAFEVEGRRLWRELQAQLGSEYKVVYFSNREARLME